MGLHGRHGLRAIYTPDNEKGIPEMRKPSLLIEVLATAGGVAAFFGARRALRILLEKMARAPKRPISIRGGSVRIKGRTVCDAGIEIEFHPDHKDIDPRKAGTVLKTGSVLGEIWLTGVNGPFKPLASGTLPWSAKVWVSESCVAIEPYQDGVGLQLRLLGDGVKASDWKQNETEPLKFYLCRAATKIEISVTGKTDYSGTLASFDLETWYGEKPDAKLALGETGDGG